MKHHYNSALTPYVRMSVASAGLLVLCSLIQFHANTKYHIFIFVQRLKAAAKGFLGWLNGFDLAGLTIPANKGIIYNQ